MRILSEADNAKHNVQAGESPMQTMLNLHRRAVEANANTGADWNKIAKQCARGQGGIAHLKDVECEAEFVRELAGGVEKPFLIELEAYWKTLRVMNAIPASMLKRLVVNARAGKWLAKHPEFALSFVKTWLSLPSGLGCTMTDSNIFKIGLSRDLTPAHEIQLKFRELGFKMGVASESFWHRILGSLDVKLNLYVTGLKVPGRKIYADLKSIAIESFNELCAEAGERAHAFPCPWHVVASAAKSTANIDTVKTDGLKQINAGGVVTVETLKSYGYVVGVLVENNTGKKFNITKLDHNVSLQPLKSGLAAHKSTADDERFAIETVSLKDLVDFSILAVKKTPEEEAFAAHAKLSPLQSK